MEIKNCVIINQTKILLEDIFIDGFTIGEYYVHYIELDYGYFTTNEDDSLLYFFPKDRYIGERFPYHIQVEDDYNLQSFIDETDLLREIRYIKLTDNGGEVFHIYELD